MFKRIITGYTHLLITLLRFMLIIVLCATVALVIIFPLWQCAVSFPQIYTLFVLIILSACILALICRKIYRFITLSGDGIEKKRQIQCLLIGFAKVAVVFSGCTFFVWSVFARKAFTGYIMLAVVVVIYGILAFGSNKKK